MSKRRKIEVGTIEYDPSVYTRDRGHDYGKGRQDSVHKDRRNKRRRTRRARDEDALKGW